METRMTLRTRICDLLEIEVPIVLAGMGGAATPELAAAVSNAGGLGVLGAAACGNHTLRERAERPVAEGAWQAATSRPRGAA